MTGFTNVFGGSAVQPAQPSYLNLSLTAGLTSLYWPLATAPSLNVLASLIDVTSNANSYVIQLPPASSGSIGITSVFNNINNTYTVYLEDGAGNTVLTMAPGTTWLVYLVNNSSIAGTWRTFQYGSQAGSINVASIAGAGLTTISNALAQYMPVAPLNASYVVNAATDRDKVFIWEGGSGTLTLPSAATAGSGWYIEFKNSGTGDCTVSPPSGTIDGSSSKIFHAATADSAVIFTDGTNYYTVGYGAGAAASSFAYTTINVGGGSNYTISGAQLNQISYKLTGVLTANIQFIVPASVQQYWINNATTGAFTLTVITPSGSGVIVGQGQQAILYCDGTNVVQAQSGASFPITIAQGGTGATTAAAALTALGGTAVGTGVFGASSTNAALQALGISNASGNWTIAAPSSGTALTLTAAAAASGFIINTSSTSPGLVLNAASSQAGLVFQEAGAFKWAILENFASSSGTLSFYDYTTGAVQLSATGPGAWTFAAPSSGVAVSINGAANSPALKLFGNSTSGQSLGLNIAAGTTSADSALVLTNQGGGTTFFSVFGDGGIVVGAATGGDLGLGSINAVSLFLNSIPAGYLNVPSNAQTVNYVTVLADAGKSIDMNGSNLTATIAANASVAYIVGTVLTFYNLNATNLTIAINTDTLTKANSVLTGSRTLAQNGVATARKIGTTSWIISGSGLS